MLKLKHIQLFLNAVSMLDPEAFKMCGLDYQCRAHAIYCFRMPCQQNLIFSPWLNKYSDEFRFSLSNSVEYVQAVDTLYIVNVQTDEATLPYPCVLWV